ncbi:ABC-type nitrate/sulfonate/bicarbonate transport system, permease component [Desulfosporosinus acidiphilus SJ4]|uniref:ABC-type nitrate/sulfonate/bicarbonate transport system, permease component n=1 Tax=Desulfosporosinus acidiphilus (strain DSM 22704 / JCM 16185 / SJ4) TaxID=646529 RepID=I4D5M5_DESAJ|nr:ABC transporter permease [Desulfosporosinus acidiphilus]AFM41099.1 ABC-type nitrate/sulfonate/bicarbonate transport system, permease component [Desulfosporosinus acidiphilus SJ4]
MFKDDEENIPAISQALTISLEHQEYLRRVRFGKISVRMTQVILLVLALVLWEIMADAKIIDPFITSQPSRIIKTIVQLYKEGVLFYHIGITCLETIVGFTLGTLLGTFLAVILWWSKFISEVAEPYLVIFNSLPKIALGPVFLVWIGAGPAAIIVMTLAISLIVTILEVLNGFWGIDQEKIKLVQTFGGNKFQVLTKVVLPASFPTIINALKINVGLSWVGVIVGEFLVSKAGLGYLIIYGGQVFRLDLVMTSVIILGVAAAIMYQGVVYLERLLVKNNDLKY